MLHERNDILKKKNKKISDYEQLTVVLNWHKDIMPLLRENLNSFYIALIKSPLIVERRERIPVETTILPTQLTRW